MSDTTETETDTNTNTDEPSKAELHDRVEKLESTVAKMMPSRRDALRMGAAGIAGAAGLGAASQTADASTGSAGDIGDPNNRPDLFADTVDANQLTGVSTGDRQGCRVFLSSQQNITSTTREKIQFDSEVFDSDSNFDTSAHEWTCPEDGLYAVNLQAEFRGTSGGDDIMVNIGSGTSAVPSGSGSQTRLFAEGQRNLSTTTINQYTANDTIAGYARNNSGNDTLGSGDRSVKTFLEVAFLGGL